MKYIFIFLCLLFVSCDIQTRDDRLKDKILSLRNQIKDLPYERGIHMDYWGDIIVNQKGTKNKLLYDHYDIRLIVNDSYISMHNHTTGNTFSLQDVKFFLQTKQCRLYMVVTSTHLYSLQRKVKICNCDKCKENYVNVYQTLHESGGKGEHEMMQKFTSHIGLKYKRYRITENE